jgi:hypothetical protein
MSQDHDYEFSNFDKGYTIHNNRAFTGGLIKDAGLYQLWAYLLHAANWKNGRLRNGETILQGQAVIGTEKLAKELESGLKNGPKTTRKMVRGRIDRLKKIGLIDTKKVQGGLLVTILDYPTYELADESKGQARAKQGPSKGQARATEEDKGKQGRQKKKNAPASKAASDPGSIEEARARAKEEVGKYRGNYPEDDRDRFDQFWAAYPRREGVTPGKKEKSMELFCGEDAGTQKLIIETLENFKQRLGKTYPVDTTTYLGPQKLWKENLDKPDVQEPEEFVQQVCYSEEQYLEALKDPANRPFISSKDRNRYD